ncbi:MAG: hypothetical protein ACJAZ4_001959, partial [Neptuniibacter pectenicola]
ATLFKIVITLLAARLLWQVAETLLVNPV